MKRPHGTLTLLLSLAAISAMTYVLQLFLFDAPRDTAFYLIQDLAFLPLQVIIVSLFLNRYISEREKRERLRKMNMAINAFFSEAGTETLLYMKQFVQTQDDAGTVLRIAGAWKSQDFDKAIRIVAQREVRIDIHAGDLNRLKALLAEKRTFLLAMLENANLLEHDAFTDMLWAVFHIMDELSARPTLEGLPANDLEHLAIDIRRSYSRLLKEWLEYMKHLQVDYPYLFSLAIRRNPFDDARSVVFKD
jgi:hypothetical protein